MTPVEMAHITAIYVEECMEQLAILEASLLELERSPGDGELIGRMFRAAHSIKGGAATFGFTAVAQLTHEMESLLDAMRDGRIVAGRAHVDVLLRGADLVRALMRSQADGSAPPATDACMAACAALIPSRAPAGAEPARPAASPAPLAYRIRFVPEADAIRNGIDPLMILRDVADLGAVTNGTVTAPGLPSLEALDPSASYLAWELELATAAAPAAIRELFDYVDEGSEIAIEPVVAATPVAVAPAAPAPQPVPVRATDSGGSLRVATEKIDALMNLVGELLVNQSMVTQSIRNFRVEQLPALQESCLAMERTTREVQERVMAIRMLPVSTVFGRVPRVVRDLSQQLGKQIEVELVGEETELDKGILEQISDPITHLVRNAVDHGLEKPDARRAAGKPETGTIRLEAFHTGGSVVIQISDDGRGLDTARIRARGVERGLITADAVLTDEQIHELILAPGFSTAETVTDVSGRGVGMDVVRRSVENLHGALSITSDPGRGSCIRLSLPLTLAILDGMCLRVGPTTYVLPLTSIVETIRPRPDQLRRVLGRGELVSLRGENFPLLRLHHLFDIPGATTDPTQGLVTIIENQGRKVGLLVDDLLGHAQLVVKGLEGHFRRVEGLVGATILGDGNVALILDVQRLIRIANTNAQGAAA